ncbi:c-type cytochrome biogenesis protein CcmI [Amylibacter sp. SFDW26]|uniref:c-type cytochrome biogenesis protein CcmI n=1 Tax=Amylibacter sp. SFDW26 TaxID=2652722 RepID=UPI001869E249|nr:c-type cytochrome biogenesis protein CcmI [Amylibacter sp. SFDW26]
MVWLGAIFITIAVTYVIFKAFLIAPAGAKAAELDVQVYKDQLKALDSDLERGVLSPEDAASARLEISRRLLAADKRVQDETSIAADGVSKSFLALIGLVLVGGSFGLYTVLGNPGLPDQPLQARLEVAKQARADRPNQAQAEAQITAPAIETTAEYMELIEKLRTVMIERPDDEKGWALLALHESRIGNFSAAWVAKDKMITLVGDKAVGEDYADLAEFMILATNGYVSVEAEGALANALKLDPKSSRARYYSGLTLAQNGRPDVAYRMWVGLLEEGPADAPWVQSIRGQIGGVARAAGIDTVNLDAPGPSARDVQAADQMTEVERQEMIGDMVAGLADRLATEGGTPAEWARLIRAYGVLGETGNASAVWKEAQDVFSGNAEALALLLEAAQGAEISF